MAKHTLECILGFLCVFFLVTDIILIMLIRRVQNSVYREIPDIENH